MLQVRSKPPTGAGRERVSTLALGARLSLTSIDAPDVPLFARCAPAHCVLVGSAVLHYQNRAHTQRAVALPAHTAHHVIERAGSALVAHLDVRRFRFEDAERLAHAWRGFVPGRDDAREAFGDALKRPRRRLDPRLERVLDALEDEPVTIAEASARSGLSESRLTHLMTEKLGAPPRVFRPWLRLRNAIGAVLFEGANYTQAAHRAGFSDSAHLARTAKRVLGVRPSDMIPDCVYVTREV